MKFACDRCGARYTVADERVRGMVFKIRCKKCANVIIVRNGQAAARPVSKPAQVGGSAVTGSEKLPVFTLPSLVDTPPAVVTAPVTVTPAPATAPATAGGGDKNDADWYLVIDGQRSGPFPRARIVTELAQISAKSDVYVWNPTLVEWVRPGVVFGIPHANSPLKKPSARDAPMVLDVLYPGRTVTRTR